MSIEQDLAVLKDWRIHHEKQTHDRIADEIRELRGTMNKIMLAIMGLMLTMAATAVGYTLSRLGG